MAELVPEPRRDKRGHTVTRWVRKDGTASPSAKKPIPKVSATSEQDKLAAHRTRTINRMAKQMMVHGFAVNSMADGRQIAEEFVGRFTNRRTFTAIDDALKREPQSINWIENIVSDYNEDKARTIIFFMEHLHEDVAENERDALLAGLKNYKEFSDVEDFTALKGQRLDEVVALIKTGCHVLAFDPQYSNGIKTMDFRATSPWHITDKKLVETVLANLDRLDEITHFMEDRRIFDGEAISSYLHEHSALNEGFL